MADSPRVAIIGSGFGGLCTAILPEKAGIESFTLSEKSLPHLRFEIESVRFDASRQPWPLRTTADEPLEAEVLVRAVGQLNRHRTD